MKKVLDAEAGQSVLLITFSLFVIFSILLYSALDLITRNVYLQTREVDQLLLDEMTNSAFAVVESALERRLWEPPPDSSCLKTETFTVKSDEGTGPEWTVNVSYNFDTKNYELVAAGSYRQLTSQFKKQIRVMDVSDYMLFSGGTQPIAMSQLYDPRNPTALIAKSRKVYANGPLTADASIVRSNPKLDWNGSPDTFPDEYGMILQGDRLQFKGGISYLRRKLSEPAITGDTPASFANLLDPYTTSAPETYYGQYGAGNLIIMPNATLAENLKTTVINPASSLVTKSDVNDFVYPVALFRGNPPLISDTAIDSGNYFNDTDRYSIFRYQATGNLSTTTGNFTCLVSNSYKSKRYCSNSEHFPKGFDKWRGDTGLSSVLFTSNTVEVPIPEIGWDQLEALEEDANACGKVVSTPENVYTDCPVWDQKFMSSYSLTGSKSCLRISELNLDVLNLKNFNPADYSDPDYRKRSLRRVLYLKTPTTLSQTSVNGIYPTITDSNIRSALSVWVVAESLLSLKGKQTDTTSPMDSEPGRMRQVSFNTDDKESVQPIAMTLLSLDTVHLLSPFYTPMSEALLTEIYPVAGGKIVPARHNLTDHKRWEIDGFRFGFRNYKIKNVNLITSTAVDPSKPFYLQGLWSGPDGGPGQHVANQCMVTLLGFPLEKYDSERIMRTAKVPDNSSPLFASANAPLPPITSAFFNGQDHFAETYYPAVFRAQQAPPFDKRNESTVELTGGRVHMNFNFKGHPTRPDLTTPDFNRIWERYSTDIVNLFDFRQRIFQYDDSRHYKTKPANTVCITDNVEYLNGSASKPVDLTALSPALNDGNYIFVFQAPDDSFRNLGAFTGVDLPTIESKR